MRRLSARYIALLALLVSLLRLGATAIAQEKQPENSFRQQLSKYDPEAVEAALRYSKVINIKESLAKAAPALAASILAQAKQKNPKLGDEQVKLFANTFVNKVFVDHADDIEQLSVIMLLQIFSKEEIVAVSNFYASEIGQSIAKKYSLFLERVPALVQVLQSEIIPKALAETIEEMKKSGVEVKI